ncbi:MAG: precorrin-6A synthase (deacetylating) [Silicimonas sp.]|jgi:precorrin-6A synthase|nr:precorrin-6A synthase (deacetylating) [Silicimonas sp.]
MDRLTLIGIGTGNPDHVTLAGIVAMRSADLILLPRKGPGKDDLADLRRSLVASHAPGTEIAEFDMPVRSEGGDYRQKVDAWHDEIARAWEAALPSSASHVGLLVWGDPSLYDSTLRIAARLEPAPETVVVPGITALQALTAAHVMPLNDINAPVVITTGRQLRDRGWPEGADRAVVMLDGECSFRKLDPEDVYIWWGAYLGMPGQILRHGWLEKVGDEIVTAREAARASHGWIMDTYLLRRTPPAPSSA